MAARASKKRRRRAVPGYLKHRSGQARVILNGRTIYLGVHGSPESHEKYSRLIREWEAGQRQPLLHVPDAAEAGTAVSELVADYWAWIESTGAYRKDGQPTSAHARVRKALDKLQDHCGECRLRGLTKQQLVVFRDKLCGEGARTLVGVNKSLQIVKRMVAWAVERGRMPDAQAMSIASLKPLREQARKKPPIPLANLEKTIALLRQTAPVVADMVLLQFLLGCRPGEVRELRWRDIDQSWYRAGREAWWLYTVASGKTSKEAYPISPEAQSILKQYMKVDPDQPIFTPRDQAAVVGVNDPDASPLPYTRSSYLQCVRRAASRANVPPFGVHQIRHTSLSLVANDRRGGLGAASALANHASQSTTARFYASSAVQGAVQAARILQGRMVGVA